jgi:hypothetical protein
VAIDEVQHLGFSARDALVPLQGEAGESQDCVVGLPEVSRTATRFSATLFSALALWSRHSASNTCPKLPSPTFLSRRRQGRGVPTSAMPREEVLLSRWWRIYENNLHFLAK